jgi:L-iditol 2-dehydrogenase
VETNQAIKLIAEKRLDIASLITHRFDIKNAADAIKCAHEAKDAMKVVVTTTGP